MTEEQLRLLLEYIDARIEERVTKNSSGPHVRFNREHAEQLREDLFDAFEF